MNPSLTTFGTVNVSEFFLGDADTKARIAREVDEICIRTGFLAVTGHGVSPELMEELWSTAREFFARDTAAKQAYRASRVGTGFQYTLMGAEALARSKGVETPPDLKESVDMTPERRTKEASEAGLDPTTAAVATKLETLMQEYYRQVAALSDRIMAIFATALKLPEELLSAHVPVADDGAAGHPLPRRPRSPLRRGSSAPASTPTTAASPCCCRSRIAAAWRFSPGRAAGRKCRPFRAHS